MNAELKQIGRSFIPAMLLLAILWAVFAYQQLNQIDPGIFGIYPRDIHGLSGILTMPFVHADLQHLFSNSIPLFILCSCLWYFYPTLARKTFVWIWILCGCWLWLGGRPASHVGASGLVYGLASFILLSGILRKERRLMALSLLVVFLYGGMVWGFFPIFFGISWEGHLFGACAGVLLAIAYRNEGPQRIPFQWELEDGEEEENTSSDIITDETDNPSAEEEKAPPADPIFRIHYEFKDPNQEEK